MRTTYPVVNPGGGAARLGAFPGPGDFEFTPPDLGPGPGPGPAPEPPAPAPVPPAPVPVPPAPTYLFPAGEGEGEAPAEPVVEKKENGQEPENGMSTTTWALIGVAGVVAVTGLVVILTR